MIARNTASVYTEKVSVKWLQTFYRLKMVDKDGSSEYSKIIKIGESSQHALSVYPNPVSNVLQVKDLLQNTTISIMGVDGKVYKSQIVSPGQGVDVSNLAKGIYFLRVGNEILRFVK